MLSIITLQCNDGRKLYYSNGLRTTQGFHDNANDGTFYSDDQTVSIDFGMLRSTLEGQSLVRDALLRPTFKLITGSLSIERVDIDQTNLSAEVRV